MRRIELWMEVQELNDEGRYAAVNIEAEPEVTLKYICSSLAHSSREVQVVWFNYDRARQGDLW